MGGPRTHQGFQKHPWSRCYAGGQPEPVEAGPWWSRGKVLHLDRGGFQEAGLSLWNLPQPKMANTDLSVLLKSEAIRKATRAPVKKIVHAVVRTNPLKNIRSMLQLNPYAAVQKKNAELTTAKNIRAKALKGAKAAGKPAPANPMAKRAAKVAKKK